MRRGFAWLGSVCCIACASDLPDVEGTGSSTTSVTDMTLGVDGTTTSLLPETTVDLDTTTSDATTDETTTTGPPPMCDEPDGTYLGTCPEDAPFCVGKTCVDCDNDVEATSCEGEAQAPGAVCAGDGRCVECTSDDAMACSEATPICDPGTNACVPCTEHAQCATAACNLFDGNCVGGMVVNAAPGPGALITAVNAVVSTGGGTIIVADGIYDEAITIDAGIVVFLAAPGASPEWRRMAGINAPHLRVTGGATVLVDGIDFRINDSNADPAVRVDTSESRIWLDRATIAQNFGIGVRAEASADLRMRNCFVGGANNIDAVDVITNATAMILYSTLGAAFGSSNAISCDGTATVTVSDSILVAQDSTAEVSCIDMAADHTATNNMMLTGEGNVAVGDIDETWFSDYSAGDYHLINGGPAMFADIAVWDEGDPTVDIDLDPRVAVPGMSERAGADVPP